MKYRDLLVEMNRRASEESPEPTVFDYLAHRNADALRAWRQRRFDYERRRLVRERPARGEGTPPTLQ